MSRPGPPERWVHLARRDAFALISAEYEHVRPRRSLQPRTLHKPSGHESGDFRGRDAFVGPAELTEHVVGVLTDVGRSPTRGDRLRVELRWTRHQASG